MRISEIKSQIKENLQAIRNLQRQISELSGKNHELHQEKRTKLLNYFMQFIELGTQYTVTKNHLYLSGVQTGLKKDEESKNPYFQKDDVFEFVKKNKSSIVIKCVKKYTRKSQGPTKYTIESEVPNTTFRIDLMNLYDSLMSDENFKKSFETYVTRTESLDLLGLQ